MPVRILFADDDASLRKVIDFKLKKRGYQVTSVADGSQALAELESERFDLLLSDMKMPGLNGIELLEQARRVQPDLQVILITAYATISQAVEAVKLGAYDYLTKPFEDEELFVAIEKALKFRKLEDENKSLRQQLAEKKQFDKVVGSSRPFREILTLVDKIAPTEATVLISGESGTGKEVIARLIHEKSYRHEGEFVAINCAAIPRELIESELFGHVKGAFTGAVRDKRGKFEMATGGTILLDEVSELEIELQAKLLRVLQEKVVEPVGSERRIEVDARVIAATNVDLAEYVRHGKFRDDLYYRLNVIPVRLPSLRERREDIPLLVRTFVRRFSPDQHIEIDNGLLDALSEHNWPGNIRELENLVERMVILRGSDHLTTNDLPRGFGQTAPLTSSENGVGQNERVTFREAEKNLIVDALNKCSWNKTKAAEYLNIPRHVLVYRMKKYEIANG
jgi:DNA-binding NtrC family response regulator